jgi:hypothetical protein
MKSLVVINESLNQMVVGKNTTLAYILSLIEKGDEVFVCVLSADMKSLTDCDEKITAIKLSDEAAKHLISRYKSENKKYSYFIKSRACFQTTQGEDRLFTSSRGSFDASYFKEIFPDNRISGENFLSSSVQNSLQSEAKSLETGSKKNPPEKILVEEIVDKNSMVLQQVSPKEIDFIIQRLEPMKPPFPPQGTEKIEDDFRCLKKLFPKHIFNYPLECYSDKGLPLIIDERYKKIFPQEFLATTTEISYYYDNQLAKKIKLIIKKYQEIYSSDERKIVIKPDNSAQTLGVFSLVFVSGGLDLKKIMSMRVADFLQAKKYRIKDDLQNDELEKIVKILCYVQFVKSTATQYSQAISGIVEDEIFRGVNSLYGKKILIQPFLEGVKAGDIRASIIKSSDGNFVLAGFVFRKNQSQNDENFTTSFMHGAVAESIESSLTRDEILDLAKKLSFVLEFLNTDIKSKYENCIEIGCDFLLLGDGKTVLLGECNHHCQGLLPIVESINCDSDSYDGGLGIVSIAIENAKKLQKKCLP